MCCGLWLVACGLWLVACGLRFTALFVRCGGHLGSARLQESLPVLDLALPYAFRRRFGPTVFFVGRSGQSPIPKKGLFTRQLSVDHAAYLILGSLK